MQRLSCYAAFRQPLIWPIAVLILLAFFISGCSPSPAAPGSTPAASEAPPASQEAPDAAPTGPQTTSPAVPPPAKGQTTDGQTADRQVFLPHISRQNAASAMSQAQAQLAYLKNSDLWVVDLPGSKLRQLTQSGDIISFVWAWDGTRLATFNGEEICFVQQDGSVRTACLSVGLNAEQAKVSLQMVWSPDQRHIVLWNPVNPWDEGAIGWLIVALDGSSTTWRIQDPVDWGLSMAPNNEPGGIVGRPLFLADGTLVGTLTHRWMCGSGGCHYQLFKFDLQAGGFSPYPNKPEEGWSEGIALALSSDHQKLINYGTFFSSRETYTTFMDIFDPATQTRTLFSLDQEAINGLALSPDASKSVISRAAGCSIENQATWATVCGLSQGFDIYTMQAWDLSTNQRIDLMPGIWPGWSPDGEWISFNSCLEAQSGGGWTSSANASPAIYLMGIGELTANSSLTLIDSGSNPTWRP